MQLERAQSIASEIVERLRPYCQEIEVAGSIRRKKRFVRDIDIVLVARDPWGLRTAINELASSFTRQGSKMLSFSYQKAQVDIYFASPETWATLLLIRTGSTAHNIHLCAVAKHKGWHLRANGEGLFDENGKRIAGDTEQSIFQALGVPYQEPEERD